MRRNRCSARGTSVRTVNASGARMVHGHMATNLDMLLAPRLIQNLHIDHA